MDGVYQDLLSPNGIGVPDPYDSMEDYEWPWKTAKRGDSSYLMDYESYEVSLGVSTGYTWNTWFGRIGAVPELPTRRTIYGTMMKFTARSVKMCGTTMIYGSL